MKLKNVIIKQNTTEEVNASVVNTLYRNKDIIQEAEGHLHTNAAKVDKIDALKDKFPNLIIDADKEIIIDAADSENEVALMEVMNTNGLVQNSNYMLKQEAEGVLSIDELKLSNITDFSYGKYFTGVNTISIPSNNPFPLFYGNGDLTTVDLRNVTKIFDNTDVDTSLFYNCFSLKSINLDNLEEYFCKVGRLNYREALFGNCISLRTIKLPKLKWLLGDMFIGCTSLRLTDFDESFPSVTSIHSGFWNQYSGFNPNKEYDSLHGREVFKNTKCNFINLPERILYIDREQFWISDTTGTLTHPLYNSKYLVWGGYKTAEDALTNIAIDNDNILTDGKGNITLKKNQPVCTKAFYENTNLKSIRGMSRIDNQAFYGCTGLTGEIDCNGGTIGNEAFRGCTNITNVKNGSIGSSTGVFQDCVGLTEITDDMWNMFNTSNGLTGNTFRNCVNLKGTLFIKKPWCGNEVFANTCITKIKDDITTRVNDGDRMLLGYMHHIKSAVFKTLTYAPRGNSFFQNTYCLKYLEFDNLSEIQNTFFSSNISTGCKIVYINNNVVPVIKGTFSLSTSFLSNIYVPIGMKSQYLAHSNWATIADRIIEVNPLEIESIKKSFYGVDFFNDKYYDTKRKPTINTKIHIEFEGWTGTNVLCGCLSGGSNNLRFWLGAWNTYLNVYTHGINAGTYIKPYTKNTVEFGQKYLKIIDYTDEVKYEANFPEGGIPNLTMYLGAANYNGIPWNNANNSKMTGTIYKYIVYEGDTLVQAWIGNENGGFDIYANEDIVLQENDRKFSLSEYVG